MIDDQELNEQEDEEGVKSPQNTNETNKVTQISDGLVVDFDINNPNKVTIPPKVVTCDLLRDNGISNIN